MKKFAKFFLYLIIAVHHPSSSLFAQEITHPQNCYQVNNVSGIVLRWSPNKARWYDIKKTACISLGTLIEIHGNSRLVVNGPPHLFSKKGLPADSLFFTFNTQMILRMAPSSFRQMSVKRAFVEQTDLNVDRKTKVENLYIDVKDAWRQTSMFLTRRNMQAESTVTTDITSAVQAKKIQLIYPGSDVMVYRDFYPARINVMWIDESNGTREYQIMFWKKNEQKVTPIAATKGDFYQIPVTTPNSYYVQIVSTDGNYQSLPHLVHVVNRLEMMLSDKYGLPVHKENFTATYPAEKFVLMTSEKKSTINFAWQFNTSEDEDDATKMQYRLLIQPKDKDKKMIAKNVSAEELALQLPVGEYTWSIDVHILRPDGSKTKISSSKRELAIIGAKDKDKNLILKQILADKTFGSGVVYLE